MTRDAYVHNEQVKLEATFSNNLAVGVLVALGYASLLQVGVPDEMRALGAFGSVVISIGLRVIAKRALKKLRHP